MDVNMYAGHALCTYIAKRCVAPALCFICFLFLYVCVFLCFCLLLFFVGILLSCGLTSNTRPCWLDFDEAILNSLFLVFIFCFCFVLLLIIILLLASCCPHPWTQDSGQMLTEISATMEDQQGPGNRPSWLPRPSALPQPSSPHRQSWPSSLWFIWYFIIFCFVLIC